MAKMGTIWDRTTEVLSGRGGTLAGIAIPTLFLPTIVRDAYVAYSTPNLGSFLVIGGLLSIVVIVLAMWGQLQLIALASDPAATTASARASANARLRALIGVSLALLAIWVLATSPAIALLWTSGLDWQAIAAGQAPASAPEAAGKVLLAFLYMLIAGIAAIFISARLAVINPVVIHERLGLGAIARAWRLTAGHTWRIVGVLILFVIVLMVAAFAAQAVSGLVFRIILGADQLATVGFIAGIVSSIVVTVFTVIAAVFVAQLYVALSAERDQIAAA